MIRLSIFVFLIVLAFAGCTRDDICPEDTATTPLLVIEFRDNADRENTKAVKDLLIYVNNTDSTQVTATAVNDTIVSIPLNTEADISSFLFEVNSASSTGNNFDTVSFNYSRQEIYINRACGFKMNFNDFFVAVEDETLNGNWILNTEMQQAIITNDNEVHLTIYH
ncbi:MAG: hypothetical protein KDC91_08120 [Flavobacteriaceae bacterium]|nr:hypothetical protein [Flavobacteriaceae bacterium]